MFDERLQRRPLIPFEHFPEGLYLLKQPSRFPVIEHYGILVTGRFLREFNINNFEPIIIHQTYPGIRIDRAITTGSWVLVGQVPPQLIPLSMVRLRAAFSNPKYDLLENNCEQVARFIAGEQKHSTQVRSGVVLALLAIFLCGSDD